METASTAVNYIADTNRWKLPEPPSWFLKRLYDYDPMLVLIPSRVRPQGVPPRYLLCRRRQHSVGLGDVARLDNKHPDTNMCYGYHVVPIAPLQFNRNVNSFTEAACESLIRELKGRDTWRISGGHNGDADAIWQKVEADEKAADDKRRKDLKSDFKHRARDAWRSLKARTGQRSKRASDFHGHARKPLPQKSQRVTLTDAT